MGGSNGQRETHRRGGFRSSVRAYEIEIPPGGRVETSSDGSTVLILDENGSFAAGFAPARAKDSNGVSVPTHYEVSGNTITQIVEHLNEDYAYPVIADPWLGVNLVGSYFWGAAPGGYTLNVNPTTWGRGFNAVTNTLWVSVGAAGWDELKNRNNSTQRSLMNNSMRDQWICHQGFASFDPQWNLERWSPNNGLAAKIAAKCQ